jgi:beta-glucosidase
MKSTILLSLLLFVNSLASGQKENDFPFQNPTLPVEERVNDLIGRLTLEEKVGQMINDAPAIERLGIPKYNWWNESLHGVARAGIATVFPQAIALAATWDTDLMYRIADVISTEARAKHHDFLHKGEREIYKGLTFWSPNINIFRDPRWGRGQETYGEDPYLTARMGVAFVKGLQGDDPKYFKVIATPKHYAVHSGPEPERHTFDAIISNHDLYDTYLPAFEACIREGGAFSVMCAYNRYMGDACCGSNPLLQKILRADWGFQGYVVSDCGAIDDIFMNHKIVQTAPEAAAIAVRAGTDLECGRVYVPAVLDALNRGLLQEEEIDLALKRLFTARFRLGMFDPPEMVPYANIPIEENDSQAHRRLSLRAAQESIVLLKNEKNLLPLKKNLKRIAVIGPTADSYLMLLGNYTGTPSKYVTPLRGIRNKIAQQQEDKVRYDIGCNLAEEGAIINNLSAEAFSSEGNAGLKAEYFKDRELSGEPFYSRTDRIDYQNWIYGARIPAFAGLSEIGSIRWSGMFKPPAGGEVPIIIGSNGGYRLYIDDKIIVEDWTEHELTFKNNRVFLDKGQVYKFRIECFLTSRRPQLLVKWEEQNVNHFKNAVELAIKSDVVIFVGGITSQLEGEEMRVDYEGFRGGDRTSLDLPRVQTSLLKALHSTGTPVILVLTSGSALATNWAQENIPAIVQLWYPGQEGGTALADVLFGDYNPAGRLPVTFYKSVTDLPPFDDYSMSERTYRYFKGAPLYPFGYGLSYTSFSYDSLKVNAPYKAGDTVKVSINVKNEGKVAGDEVIQVYVSNMDSTKAVPIRALKAFKRIRLLPSQEKTIDLALAPEAFSIINDQDERTVLPGEFEISVGGGQPVSVPGVIAAGPLKTKVRLR